MPESVFPVKSAKFLRTPFLTEHLRWLLLVMIRLYKAFITMYIFNMNNYTRYGAYYAKELMKKEELYPRNKEILSNS